MMASLASGTIPGPVVVVLDSALRSMMVAAVVWTGLRILRVHNVIAQKAAWGLVLAGTLLMPLLTPWAARQQWLPSQATVLLPAYPWMHRTAAPDFYLQTFPAATETSSMADLPPAAPTTASEGVSLVRAHSDSARADRFPAPVISSSRSEPATRSGPPQAGNRSSTLFALILSIYIGISGALVLRLAIGLGAAARLWLEAEPVSITGAPGWTAGLRLRSSCAIASPVTVGSGIVLPADYIEWDVEKLRIVLAHERSHVRQGDFYLQACAGLYAAVFWFSPLGWWLKRKLSDLSEAISDRAGINEAASRASYAQILLEFAALPRLTQIGVAMARPGSLTHRIERLLNDSSFSQAFAGGRRRILVAVLLVPTVLFAATALIRVEAAGQAAQPPAATQATAPTAPDQIADPPQPPATVTAPQAPAPPETMSNDGPPAPPAAITAQVGDSSIASNGHTLALTNEQENTNSDTRVRSFSSTGKGYSYSYSSNGDSYGLVKGNAGEHIEFSGDWDDSTREKLDKARKMAHGDFLWFTRGGKAYILDDQQTVAKIEEMYKPIDELGRQQGELGRQQEALGKQQEELGRRQEQASIPTPDLAKEMAELNAAVAKLQAQKGATVTQDQLGDLEGKIGNLEGKLGSLQGEIGAKQGQLGSEQGKLGAEQGKLGAQQGRLGAEQGRIAREADHKIKSIIDESLKGGKARPIE